MAGKVGIEVLVARAEYQRDGQVEGGQVSGGDVTVLLVERREQRSGPGADGGQRIGPTGSAEELRQDGDGADATRVECQPEPGRGVSEEPLALGWVAHHG